MKNKNASNEMEIQGDGQRATTLNLLHRVNYQ